MIRKDKDMSEKRNVRTHFKKIEVHTKKIIFSNYDCISSDQKPSKKNKLNEIQKEKLLLLNYLWFPRKKNEI